MTVKKTLFSSVLPVILFLFFSCTLCGCSIGSGSSSKGNDLDFTVVSEDRLSEELKTVIDERKAAPFKVTYSDGDYLYICIGYGEQQTGGYSIAVDKLHQTEEAIYVSTSLLGPGPQDDTGNAPSYPYIVIKIKYVDKSVIFE